MQNNECAPERWGRLYSLWTRFPAGPAGREAGCGQDCPPDSLRENWWDFGRITPAGLCLTNEHVTCGSSEL